MTNEQILIVEDDDHIAKLLKYNLEKAGFVCRCVITGEEAFEVLKGGTYALVILDVMLPKMDGFEVCREIRRDPRSSSIPILMLTARGEEIDRIVGLEIGADDYMVKPFSPRELILRVKAILRRGTKQDKSLRETYVSGGIVIDTGRHRVLVDEKDVPLTAMEFKLLLTLMQRKGRVQTRDVLLNDVWDMDAEVTTRTIDTHIKRLRQKLTPYGDCIETVRGHGYRFSDEE